MWIQNRYPPQMHLKSHPYTKGERGTTVFNLLSSCVLITLIKEIQSIFRTKKGSTAKPVFTKLP